MEEDSCVWVFDGYGSGMCGSKGISCYGLGKGRNCREIYGKRDFAAGNRVLLDAVKKAGVPYLKNETDLEQAVRETISQVNIYLSE